MLAKNEIFIKIFTTLFTLCYITNVILCEAYIDEPCPATISPSSDIKLEENETLIVYCQLKNVSNRCNSKYLSFNWDQKREYTSIINNSTIQLKIENAKAMDEIIICKYNDTTGLMPFSVQVGHKPTKIKFECFSKNFESLSCRGDLPQNMIPVQYTAVFWPSTPSNQPSNNCGVNTYDYSTQITNCTEEFRMNKTCTVVVFRKHWNYTFEITGNNSLGTYCQREEFDIKRIVIPNKPFDVQVTNVTSRSANLTWSLPHNFQVFKNDFIHRVTLNSTQIINVDASKVKRISQLKFNLELPNLEYAHTWYNVQIFYRVANALYGDRQWSDYSSAVFRTLARIPDTPPETSPGAFYQLEQNETIIYWKELPAVKHNGPNLTYTIFEVTENGKVIQKEPKGPYTTTTARYDSINPESEYEFKLNAHNEMGSSENYSVIRIPSVRQRISKPLNLKKILSQSIYNLTWDNPYESRNNYPDSYTIYRCDPVDEQESLCNHLIDFDEVDGHETQYIYNNTIEKNTKIFAITANVGNYSSGMVWFPCSATVNSDMTKFPSWLEVLGPTEIKVSWSLRCDTTPLLKGFNISYCALIGDPKEKKCNSDGEFNQFVSARVNETVIRELTAYTTYHVKISMFNGGETGPAVELQNTTASGVPTPPTDLIATHVTNTSITLQWNQPEFWNGKDQRYKIMYTALYNKVYEIKWVERVSDQYLPTNYTLDNLDSFTYYNITIAGCNPACSSYSNEIRVTTKTGKPKVVQTVVNEGDTLRPVYKWLPPSFRGGNLDFYEFKIGIKINGKYLSNPRIIILNSTQCTLRSKVCNENVEQYNVSVRAVNMAKREIPLTNSYYTRNHNEYTHMDKSSQIYCMEEFIHDYYYQCNTDYDCIAGEWKEGIISECLYDSETFRFYLILFVGLSIGFGILVGVVIGMKKFHKMRDIGVELPEGLEDIDKVKPPMDTKPDKMDNNKLDDEQTMRLIGTDNKSASSFSLERKSQSSDFIDSDNEHTLNEDSVSNSPMYEKISNDNLKFDEDASCNSDNSSQNMNSNNSNLKNLDVIQQSSQQQQQQNPQSIIQVMNPISNMPQSLPIMSNGYVSNAFLMPSANGYVQHSALMNMNVVPALPPAASVPSSNGYTSFAALMNQNKQQSASNRGHVEPPKQHLSHHNPHHHHNPQQHHHHQHQQQQQQSDTNNIKTPIVTSTNGISGYVTHKQLSDFHNTLMQ